MEDEIPYEYIVIGRDLGLCEYSGCNLWANGKFCKAHREMAEAKELADWRKARAEAQEQARLSGVSVMRLSSSVWQGAKREPRIFTSHKKDKNKGVKPSYNASIQSKSLSEWGSS